MDTSKERIKMCKEAGEIQKQWIPSQGDWFYKQDGIGFGLWVICYIKNGILLCAGEKRGNRLFDDKLVEFRLPEMYIWLPHQDQLQEMLLDYDDPLNRFMTSVCHSTLVCNFAQFCGVLDEDAEGRSNVDIRKESLEVLWLAFVMAEKYSKVWDGDKWIKDDDIDFGKPKRLMPWEVE